MSPIKSGQFLTEIDCLILGCKRPGYHAHEIFEGANPVPTPRVEKDCLLCMQHPGHPGDHRFYVPPSSVPEYDPKTEAVVMLPPDTVMRPQGTEIEHPSYYGGDTVYETIKVIRAWELGFLLGNVMKYIARAGKKASSDYLTDLKKAEWYLKEAIQEKEGKG